MSDHAASSMPLLEVRNLTVTFGRKAKVYAVNDVSFTIARRETVALVGESGSGKSTIARAISGLVPYTGYIGIAGQDLGALTGRRRTEAAPLRQMVFQDPYSSLDPSMTVGEIILEPLRRLRKLDTAEKGRKVSQLLDEVQLPRSFASRLPHELSGGQRQRVAIARAVSVEPELVICDEALSALDVTTQAEVIDLLERLRLDQGLSYLFIAHDLSVVKRIADRVAVMYFGRLMEEGDTLPLFRSPAHPYTRALLSAAPVPNPHVQRSRQRIILGGEPPDPTNPPGGCVFAPRCASVMPICSTVVPTRVRTEVGTDASCHLYPPGALDGACALPVRDGSR